MATKGFFGSLVDLSFSSLVTTKVIKLVYVLTLVAIGIMALVFTLAAFQQDAAIGALTLLIIAPVMSLFYAVYARVGLEFVMAVFRIMETNVALVELARQNATPAPPAGPPAPEAPATV